MFRLVKILNGRTNQGEPVRLPCGERNIEFGEALCLEDGEIYTCASGEVPGFISCEKHSTKSNTPHTALAIPISPDMVFEVPVAESLEDLVPGARVTLADSRSVKVTAENGIATVLDTCGAVSAGDKIHICFK